MSAPFCENSASLAKAEGAAGPGGPGASRWSIHGVVAEPGYTGKIRAGWLV